MRRRDVLHLLGGVAAWPLATRAQSERARKVALLTAIPQNDLLRVLRTRLGALGWREGVNLEIDARVTGFESLRAGAKALVASRPDLIVARSSPETVALRAETDSIPIVFPYATDPVGGGFVSNLARPGGNITGFMNFEYPMAGKWLELLREIAPGIKRVLAIHHPDNVSTRGYFEVMEPMAQSLGIGLKAGGVRSVPATEAEIVAFAREPAGGLVLIPDALFSTVPESRLIIATLDRQKLPAVFPGTHYVHRGGLLSYAASFLDLFERAAGYIDRILRGAKPGDLPVQAPTRFELAINLKTAKTLGLSVPPSLIVRADEVIE